MNRRGFTIVEVLIAIALLAALTSVTWVSMNNLYKSRDMIGERAERYQQVRGVFDRMSQEIGSAFIAGPTLGGEQLPDSSGETFDEGTPDSAAMNRREAQQYGMIGNDKHIDFTTMGHRQTQLNERTGYSSEIGYFLRPTTIDGRRTNQLMRREDVTIDDKLNRGGIIFPVLPDIKNIKFEYWDTGPVKLGNYDEIANGRWVSDWDTTNSAYAGRLPTRMRVTLTMPPQGHNKVPEVFSTQIPINTTEVMEF